MTDNPTKRGPQDRIRISLKQRHERAYWSRKFNCTVPRLREAVEQAGHMAVDVASFLLDGEWQDDLIQGQGE